jgi:L-arabinonolactonase
MTEIRCVIDAQTILGEGPLWDERDEVLWWLDIKCREIRRYSPASGQEVVYEAPEEPGSLAVRERGGLVVAMASGFHFFDPSEGRFVAVLDPEPNLEMNRFNDGKPDRQGRFWAGTMNDPPTRQTAALYRLDADLSCHRIVENVCCSNALAWSPDSHTMYYADSFRYRVWAWDFDPDSGEIENRRDFINLEWSGGIADGATVDSEGCYWLAVPNTGKLLRFDPSGELMTSILLPVDQPTCPMFGGAELDTLYVTTARFNRPSEVLTTQPQAGGLFALDVGVKGLPEARFRG